MTETLTQKCIRLEHFETPVWAAESILKKEILTQLVIDPCVGSGVLAEAAKRNGYKVISFDVEDWGYPSTRLADFLTLETITGEFSVLMNPPFSKAIAFVEKAFELGARKVVCFQRFAWWESDKRRLFWQKHPPSRIYICGDRADCWRHDIPADKRGSSTPTAHAWFVFEKGHPAGTLLGHCRKQED